MSKLKGLSGLLGLTALVLLLSAISAGLGTGSDQTAFAAADGGGNWKNVTILYLNDIKGKIEPCG